MARNLVKLVVGLVLVSLVVWGLRGLAGWAQEQGRAQGQTMRAALGD